MNATAAASHRQLVLEVDRAGVPMAEEACFAHGALAVTCADARDDPVLEPAPGEAPLWPSVRMTALFEAGLDLAPLAAELERLAGVTADGLRVEDVAPRAWEREWLRDFRPMRFGRRLWICPGGQPAGADDALALELDPGLAFGTGTHPTTALCLEWLDGADVAGRAVLDYGCGSGILALAALRLGAASAVATDIDPQALIATRDNARRNGLEAGLTVCEPAALPALAWDIVIANILAGPLVELAPRLAVMTRPAGRIVLAGMLAAQAAAVAQAYRPWFDMRTFATREDWSVLEGRRNDG